MRLAFLIAAVQQGTYSADNLAAAAQVEVPFYGSIEGVEIAVEQFPSVFVDGSATANSNHFGGFAMTYELQVDIATPPPFDTRGSSVFKAANGDSLFTDIIGVGTPTVDANVLSVREEHTITGGTNRFAGATGSFVRTYSLVRDTGATSGLFEGIIVVPEPSTSLRCHRSSQDMSGQRWGGLGLRRR
jgi:hypothetical protein